MPGAGGPARMAGPRRKSGGGRNKSQVERKPKSGGRGRAGGWAGWLIGWAAAKLGKLGKGEVPQPRLALIERITLAPRQSLALVEAEGRRILVAVSAEGGPAFYALDEGVRAAGTGQGTRRGAPRAARISW